MPSTFQATLDPIRPQPRSHLEPGFTWAVTRTGRAALAVQTLRRRAPAGERFGGGAEAVRLMALVEAGGFEPP